MLQPPYVIHFAPMHSQFWCSTIPKCEGSADFPSLLHPPLAYLQNSGSAPGSGLYHNDNNNAISFLVRCHKIHASKDSEGAMAADLRAMKATNYRWQLRCIVWADGIMVVRTPGHITLWRSQKRQLNQVFHGTADVIWIFQSTRPHTSCRPILVAEGMQPVELGLGSGICLSPRAESQSYNIYGLCLSLDFVFLSVYPEHFKHLNF